MNITASQHSHSSVAPVHHAAPVASSLPTVAFDQLGLSPDLLRAVRETGYTHPTPIQVRAIPHVLEGRDLLGCAQTGTGKTAAFALPILDRLLRSRDHRSDRRQIGALVLTPTRELASQINENFQAYGAYTGLRCGTVFGGVSQRAQEQMLARGLDILVATPGRLLDLISLRRVPLAKLEVLVLDEADRMLDMGFLPDVRRILAVLPKKRQTLFFSATMPEPIRQLTETILNAPVRVAVTPVASTAERITQSLYFVDRTKKGPLLEHILANRTIDRALVFTRTKRRADQVALRLCQASIGAKAIHGNKSQGARERALADFKSGDIRVLVATDIAARGIDVDSISHVVNYELPEVPETYVHRIGRTARAGASGAALSFCDASERTQLRDIERLLGMPVPKVTQHPYPSGDQGGAAAAAGPANRHRGAFRKRARND
ncbi:MAG TPA: DEAD/DEAH box helicase [Polyangiaceae bacterium]|nr:DEAD/DEAH box helicase [Polyangiaceae bacterium]